MRRAPLALGLLLTLAPLYSWAGPLDDGARLVKAGAYEEAIPFLLQAAKANPKDPKPHDLLSEAYQNLYRLDAALTERETAIDIRYRLAQDAAKGKAQPAAAADEPLPPIYVKPGPRNSLPAVTNDNLPKTPSTWKATPIDIPKKPMAAGSDAETKPAAAGSDAAPVARPATVTVPKPLATPVPKPNFAPITNGNPLPYDPAKLEPSKPQIPLPELPQ